MQDEMKAQKHTDAGVEERVAEVPEYTVEHDRELLRWIYTQQVFPHHYATQLPDCNDRNTASWEYDELVRCEEYVERNITSGEDWCEFGDWLAYFFANTPPSTDKDDETVYDVLVWSTSHRTTK
uniref:Uncharacterized protein n=1 Tax=Lygus hesperus TaxID=30085 RepID=A0A0A9XWT4_LYGHE